MGASLRVKATNHTNRLHASISINIRMKRKAIAIINRNHVLILLPPSKTPAFSEGTADHRRTNREPLPVACENPFVGIARASCLNSASTSVSIYVAPRQNRPAQTWKTLLVLGHGRRQLADCGDPQSDGRVAISLACEVPGVVLDRANGEKHPAVGCRPLCCSLLWELLVSVRRVLESYESSVISRVVA